jgi:hypothetical protein
VAAAYRCRVRDYDASTAMEKLGHLIAASAGAGFSTHFHKQTKAWEAEFEALIALCAYLSESVPGAPDWYLLFEYDIPRRERRPDVVLLADDVLFVLEFKVGAQSFLGSDEWQAYSYALDLRDFHAQSDGRTIIPVLVATSAPDVSDPVPASLAGLDALAPAIVFPTVKTNVAQLGQVIAGLHSSIRHDLANRIDPDAWERSAYRPTPTIIQAAEELFAGHTVSNISHAFATNLDVTTAAIVKAVQS